MKTSQLIFPLLMSLVLLNDSAHACPILTLAPSHTSVEIGQALYVDINVQGLDGSVAQTIGTFDLDVSFDPAVLAVDQVVFGDRLGDPDPMAFETLTSVLLGAGFVDFAQVSFLSTAELMDLQPAGFRLATISFSALASGSAPLTLSQIRVDDPFGNKISIPGPGTLPLLLIGCIPTVLCRRRGDGSCSVRAERQGDAD